MNTQKKMFLVLGAARSGTSTLTRALKTLGINLGDQLTPAHQTWNPKGFWEDKDIVYNINGRVFSTLDFAAYGIQLLTPAEQTSNKVQEMQQAAEQLLLERLQDKENWGFKDPSTVKLLYFWQAVFARLNLADHYVIALRNPLSTAQSYQDRTHANIGIETGLLVWLMHLLPALEGTQGKKRIVVSYEHMLQNPLPQLQRIKDQLAISHTLSDEDIQSFTQEFLDKNLTHYQFTLDDLKNHNATAIAPLCLQTYELLLKLANDEIPFDSTEYATHWLEIKNEFQRQYPLYSYIDTLLKKNHELTKNLQKIERSWLWRLYKPLQQFYDRLRSNTRKDRNSKRIVKAYG